MGCPVVRVVPAGDLNGVNSSEFEMQDLESGAPSIGESKLKGEPKYRQVQSEEVIATSSSIESATSGSGVDSNSTIISKNESTTEMRVLTATTIGTEDPDTNKTANSMPSAKSGEGIVIIHKADEIIRPPLLTPWNVAAYMFERQLAPSYFLACAQFAA